MLNTLNKNKNKKLVDDYLFIYSFLLALGVMDRALFSASHRSFFRMMAFRNWQGRFRQVQMRGSNDGHGGVPRDGSVAPTKGRVGRVERCPRETARQKLTSFSTEFTSFFIPLPRTLRLAIGISCTRVLNKKQKKKTDPTHSVISFITYVATNSVISDPTHSAISDAVDLVISSVDSDPSSASTPTVPPSVTSVAPSSVARLLPLLCLFCKSYGA